MRAHKLDAAGVYCEGKTRTMVVLVVDGGEIGRTDCRDDRAPLQVVRLKMLCLDR